MIIFYRIDFKNVKQTIMIDFNNDNFNINKKISNDLT